MGIVALVYYPYPAKKNLPPHLFVTNFIVHLYY